MTTDVVPSRPVRLGPPGDGGEVMFDMLSGAAAVLEAERPRPVTLIAEPPLLRLDFGMDGSVALARFFDLPADGSANLLLGRRPFPVRKVRMAIERARAAGLIDGDEGVTAILDADGLHLGLDDWMVEAPAEPGPPGGSAGSEPPAAPTATAGQVSEPEPVDTPPPSVREAVPDPEPRREAASAMAAPPPDPAAVAQPVQEPADVPAAGGPPSDPQAVVEQLVNLEPVGAVTEAEMPAEPDTVADRPPEPRPADAPAAAPPPHEPEAPAPFGEPGMATDPAIAAQPGDGSAASDTMRTPEPDPGAAGDEPPVPPLADAPVEPAPPEDAIPSLGAAVLATEEVFELPRDYPADAIVEGHVLEHRSLPGLSIANTGRRPTTLGGSVRLHADGHFSYEPPAGLRPGDRDSFPYIVTDGVIQEQGTVTLAIPGGDAAPDRAFAAPVVDIAAHQDTELVLDADAGLFALLDEPFAQDWQIISIGTVLTASGGSAAVTGKGALTYLPPPGFNGTDQFDCSLEAPNGEIWTVTVRFAVAPTEPERIDRPLPEAADPDPLGATGREYRIPVPPGAGVGARVQLLVDPNVGADGVDVGHMVLEHFDGDTWRPFNSGDAVSVVEPGDAVLVRVIAFDIRGRTLRRNLVQARIATGEVIPPPEPPAAGAPPPIGSEEPPVADADPSPASADGSGVEARPPPAPPLPTDQPAPAPPQPAEEPDAAAADTDAVPAAETGQPVAVELFLPVEAPPTAPQRRKLRLVDPSAPADEPPPLALEPEQIGVRRGDDWEPVAPDGTVALDAGTASIQVRVLTTDRDMARLLNDPDGLELRLDPPDEDVLVLSAPLSADTEIVTTDDDAAQPPFAIGPPLVSTTAVALDTVAGPEVDATAAAVDLTKGEAPVSLPAQLPALIELAAAVEAAEAQGEAGTADAPTTVVIAADAPDFIYAEDDIDPALGGRGTSRLFDDFGDPWLDISLTPEELMLPAPADAGQGAAADAQPARFALIFNIDMSGSMAWSFDGTERPALLESRSRLGVVIQAIKDLLALYVEDGHGPVTRVRFQPFTDDFSEADAQSFETLTDLEAISEYLDGIVAGGFTRYERVLEATALWLGDPRNRAMHNIVYLLSDGSESAGFDPIGTRIGDLYQGYNAPGHPSLRIYAYGLGRGSDDLAPERLGDLFNGVQTRDPLVPHQAAAELHTQIIRVTSGLNLFAVMAETLPTAEPEVADLDMQVWAPRDPTIPLDDIADDPTDAPEAGRAAPIDTDDDPYAPPSSDRRVRDAGSVMADDDAIAATMEALGRRVRARSDRGPAADVPAGAVDPLADAYGTDPDALPPADGHSEASGLDALSARLDGDRSRSPSGPADRDETLGHGPPGIARHATFGRVIVMTRDQAGTALRPAIEVIEGVRLGDPAKVPRVDQIDVSDLMPKGMTSASTELNQYVQVSFVGNDLEIQVDIDGARDGFQPQLILVLPDQAVGRSFDSGSTTLRQLIGDGNLMVDRVG